ncbi:MAG: hypothetical protein GY939_02555 [Actinomycetia bacterium]|nr:hypothetical protein [Actinomycetes bacterium]
MTDQPNDPNTSNVQDRSTGSVARDVATVGLSMSGGGYRASAWGLGALLALSDLRSPHAPPSETVATVRMVASVSGGSITNADFGLGLDLSTATADDVDARATRLAPKLVGDRRFFLPVLLLMALVHLGVGLFLDGPLPNGFARWGVAAAAATVVGVAVGPRSCDLLFGWWPAWLYVGVIAAGISAIVWLLAEPWGIADRLGWALLAIFALAVVLAPRPYVVQHAFHMYLRGSGIDDPTLQDLDGNVVHVICAAEVSGSNLLYLGPGFAHNEDYGSSVAAGGTPVAAAVQASSNLPGAFPIRWLSNKRLGLSGGGASAKRFLPVTDGGAYDNMGSQWFIGLRNRIRRLPENGEAGAQIAALLHQPDVVVIANASGLGQTKWSPLVGIPLIGWVLGLLRIKTILYEQTTASRRTSLINDRFDKDDPLGALVHIASTPAAYVRFQHASNPTQRTSRATGAFEALGAQNWAEQATANAGVATAFWPLSPTLMSQVIHHAYLQTMLNMHVKLGTPLRMPARAEFDGLVAGRQRALETEWVP